MSELHHLERLLLHILKKEKMVSLADLEDKSGLPKASVSRAMLWLHSKGYLKIEEKKQTLISLDVEGKYFLKNGFPERILVDIVMKKGGSLPLYLVINLFSLSKKEVNIALGWARKKGWLRIVQEENKPVLVVDGRPDKGPDEKLVEAFEASIPIDNGLEKTLIVETLTPELVEGLRILKGRPNVIREVERIERFIGLTSLGLDSAQRIVDVSREVSQLSPELIKSGEWRSLKLRKYDIKAKVGLVWPGKKQPFLRFLDELKWKLVSLGFKEMTGPLIEFMFFNCDALYMPQDHPAREIHDIYYIKNPSIGDLSLYTKLVKRVKSAHENGWKTGSRGWGYLFSIEKTQRLILRSQGTALSARMLLDEKLEIPGKYFSISRCYRPDVVDRTHLTEFNQIEGIILGKNLTFRDLLGVLERFALEIAGAEKVKFRPDYFPFTEPSVELAAYKDGFGWIEFGGAGIFRPEMTIPLGIKVPVIAWGLGVNRIFMMKSGINDIREIFTQNLEWLRMQKVI